MSEDRWTEDNSEVYRQLAGVAVPSRAEQIATLLALIPFQRDSRVRIVELASGEGLLSEAILHAFPNAALLVLDGEETMRAATGGRLRPFGARATVDAFEMRDSDWYHLLDGAACVVSSLCVHHLNDAEKQTLFKAIYGRLSADGVLLLADLVQPARTEARELFASTWDRAAHQQSVSAHGTTELYDVFVAEHWNCYRYPDPFDKPSGLFEQLRWLTEAGFAVVDCFWMQVGHAIYGGYRQAGENLPFGGVPFEEALAIASSVLDEA